jgi:hypothetical protein
MTENECAIFEKNITKINFKQNFLISCCKETTESRARERG